MLSPEVRPPVPMSLTQVIRHGYPCSVQDLWEAIAGLVTEQLQWKPHFAKPLNQVIVQNYCLEAHPDLTRRLLVIFDRVFCYRTQADVLAPIDYNDSLAQESRLLALLQDPWLWLMIANYRQAAEQLSPKEQTMLQERHALLIEEIKKMVIQVKFFYSERGQEKLVEGCKQLESLCTSGTLQERAYPLQASIMAAARGQHRAVRNLLQHVSHRAKGRITAWACAAAVANRQTACVDSLAHKHQSGPPETPGLILAVARLTHQSDLLQIQRFSISLPRGQYMTCIAAALTGSRDLFIKFIKYCSPEQVSIAFTSAIHASHHEIVQWFLTQDFLLTQKNIDLGLEAAVWTGKIDLLEQLLNMDRGKSPSREGIYKALQLSIETGQEEMLIKLLLSSRLERQEREALRLCAEQIGNRTMADLLQPVAKYTRPG